MTGGAAKILLIEDEADIAEGIRMNLVQEGHEVRVVDRGDRALTEALGGGYDLLILDVMLPGMDGVELCARLREAGQRVPVLFLSALGDTEDRIHGLRAGGDDYLPKPFDLHELLLRTEALLRRSRGEPTPPREILHFGTTQVDLRSGLLTTADFKRQLSDKEFRLLRYLGARRGEIVQRGEILDVVWGLSADPTERTVDNFVARLRKLLGDSSAEPRWLHTHRGLGYRLTPGKEQEGAT
jgi:DNA-binding response OmpR family regulator